MSQSQPAVPALGPRVPDAPAPATVEPRLAPPGQRTTSPPSPPPAASAAGSERRPGLTPVSLFLTLLVAYVAIEVQLVLILVLMALVLATAIERPVQLLERRHVPRPLGIFAVYALIVGAVSLVFVLAAPAIGSEGRELREQFPARLQGLQQQWQGSANPLLAGPGRELLGSAVGILQGRQEIDVPTVPGGAAIDVATGIGSGVVSLLTVFVIAFYYLMEKRWLRRLALDEIAPEHRPRVGRVWDNVEAKVGDWLRGQLVLCLTIGLLATVGYAILDVPFWPLLGLWAGLTEIVPVVGPWLGGVPAVFIALTQSWNTAFLVLGFIVIIQTLENTVLVPRIMRGAVGLTPLTVFVAILAGTQFRGIVGALLAIPVAAAVQVVLTDFLDARRAAQADSGAPISGWRWMRGPLGASLVTTPSAPSPAPAAAPLQPSAPPAGDSAPPPDATTPTPLPAAPAVTSATPSGASWTRALTRTAKPPARD